jgi:peptidoglycan hydrolase-like protein with peptidoglycan-binding domain
MSASVENRLILLRRFAAYCTFAFVLGLAATLSAEVGAARAIDLPTEQGRELSSESELILRLQTMLKKMDHYFGPVDGQMNNDLGKAIRAYQKQLGKKVGGLVSEELANHMDTQSRVGTMLRRLEQIRKKDIAAARLIIVALRNIARAQAKAGRIDEAWQAARVIPSAFQRLEAFAAIADIQLKNKDHDGTHETAAQIVLLSAKLKNPL